MQAFTTKITSGKALSPAGLLIIYSLILLLLPTTAFSQTALKLVIQPIQSEQKTREIFQPLADYIEFITEQQVELVTYPNYISYWSETKKPDSYDISFDAAHFIDYRDKNLDFTVLAKQPGIISISLIVPEDSLVFDAEELIGKKIATPGPPSIAAVRIDELFDNPVRLPTIIEGTDSGHVMAMLLEGKADAAMLPTPLVSAQIGRRGWNINGIDD